MIARVAVFIDADGRRCYPTNDRTPFFVPAKPRPMIEFSMFRGLDPFAAPEDPLDFRTFAFLLVAVEGPVAVYVERNELVGLGSEIEFSLDRVDGTSE